MADFQERIDKRYMGETYEFEDHYWWFQGLRYFTMQALERLPEFERLRQKPMAILDAGCGTGANMIMFGRYGKVFGLDFLEECIHRCRTRGLTHLCQASVSNIPFRKEAFDLVSSFDVLVCLDGEKDEKALCDLYDVCRPEGLLILNLATFNFLRSDHDIVGGAVRRYTRGELKAKLERAGFKVLTLTYRNTFLFPVLLVLRFIKNFRQEKTSDHYPLPASINSFFYYLLRLEAGLCAWFNLPFGSSIFAVAQKPK
jgi:ubiquinone/menaquinone biosynthesis C-methylase UbiE